MLKTLKRQSQTLKSRMGHQWGILPSNRENRGTFKVVSNPTSVLHQSPLALQTWFPTRSAPTFNSNLSQLRVGQALETSSSPGREERGEAAWGGGDAPTGEEGPGVQLAGSWPGDPAARAPPLRPRGGHRPPAGRGARVCGRGQRGAPRRPCASSRPVPPRAHPGPDGPGTMRRVSEQ